MSLNKANIEQLIPNAVITSTATGAAVDVTKYNGTVQVVLSSSIMTGTTPTLDVKMQDSADGSTGWADISGATFAQVTDAADLTEMITFVVGDNKAFIRAVGTITGTTPSVSAGVALIAERQAGYNASQAI